MPFLLTNYWVFMFEIVIPTDHSISMTAKIVSILYSDESCTLSEVLKDETCCYDRPFIVHSLFSFHQCRDLSISIDLKHSSFSLSHPRVVWLGSEILLLQYWEICRQHGSLLLKYFHQQTGLSAFLLLCIRGLLELAFIIQPVW
ncbi:hypothetical protein D3C74_354570 [compost metagenome]